MCGSICVRLMLISLDASSFNLMYICLNLLILFMIHGVVGYFGHNRNRTELTESKICSDFVVTKLIGKTEEPVSSVRLDRTPGLKHITTQLIDLGLEDRSMCSNLCTNSIHLSPIKDTREIDPNCTHLGSYSAAGPSVVTRDGASFLFFFKYSNCILYITHKHTHTIKHVQFSLLQLLIPEAAMNPGMKTYDEYIQHVTTDCLVLLQTGRIIHRDARRRHA